MPLLTSNVILKKLMNRLAIILFIVISTFSQNYAHSDENEYTEADLKNSITFTTILGAQVLFFIHSENCSSIPNTCGGITAIATPLLASMSDNISSAGWAAIIGIEALSAYNLSVDEDNKSKNDLLVNNMIALNLIAGISYYLLDDFDTKGTVSLQPILTGGAQLVFNYKF